MRCKDKGATRAARAQCTYPVLSAKRRHQLHDFIHRRGGAEHLRQQRQSACGEHKGSAAAGPLRLVRAARRDGWARGACGTRVPWLASMVQGPDGPRESARRQPPYLGRTCAYHLKREIIKRETHASVVARCRRAVKIHATRVASMTRATHRTWAPQKIDLTLEPLLNCFSCTLTWVTCVI